MKRFLYNLFGIEYIGSKEQLMIDQVKHQKYLLTNQIKHSNIKLKSIKEKEPEVEVNPTNFKKRRFNYSRNKKFTFKKTSDY